MSFVVHLFSSADPDLYFGQPSFVDEEEKRDQGNARVLDALFDLVQFSSLQQEFADAQRIVVVDIAVAVFLNVHVPNEELTSIQIAVALRNIGFAIPEGLDLCAHQGDPRQIALQDLVLKARLSVGNADLFFLLLFAHVERLIRCSCGP